MEIKDFWHLIERSRTAADDTDGRTEWLVERLVERSIQDVVDFNGHRHRLDLDAFQWPLWAATCVITGGYSDASFDCFREWLIGLGRETYERVVADPDALADVPEVRELAARKEKRMKVSLPEWEDLVFVPVRAYAEITGEDEDEAEAALDLDGLAAEPPGEGWDLSDMEENARRLPRMCALFGWTS
ncbi:hypothetical protein GCM10010466_21240 [Planomonospora alba]|uniref:DUF4240 domain-containing protein n=1 Tax=Planomonospora alba TaxID=161354 RepID=A0ABP6MYH1_9ACTN